MTKKNERIHGLIEQIAAVEAKRVKEWKSWSKNLRAQLRAVMRGGAQ